MEGIERLKLLLEMKDLKDLELAVRSLDIAMSKKQPLEAQTTDELAGYQVLSRAGVLRNINGLHSANPHAKSYLVTELGRQVHRELKEDNFYKTETTPTY